MSSDEEEFEFDGAAEEEEEAGEEEEEEEEEEDFIDDDDEPISKSVGRTRRASSSKVSYNDDNDDDDDDDDDDSDDDIPLAKLKSPSKKSKKVVKKKAATPAKKKTVTKKKIATKKPEPRSKSASSSSDDYRNIAAAMFGSESIKGQLIQKLLCRWWYSIDWPTNLPDKPPKNYDAMDGMPGVFVCSCGDKVGTIKDFRDMENKPSFSNFMSKDSDELKDLLLAAVEAQKKALIEAEGTGTPTEKELNDMTKWTKKVNADKADKEAARVLKKAGMALQ